MRFTNFGRKNYSYPINTCIYFCNSRAVFLNVGGNDITSRCCTDTIFRDIVNIAEVLYANGVEKVFIASIVQRGKFKPWTGLDSDQFRMIRRSINKKLKSKYGECFVEVDKRLIFPRHYDSDLVHPGDKEGGMNVLMHAVMKCFKKM